MSEPELLSILLEHRFSDMVGVAVERIEGDEKRETLMGEVDPGRVGPL